MRKEMEKYRDILYLNRPQSQNHVPMPLMERAAQFAPFAALTGHSDAIRSTEKQVEEEMENLYGFGEEDGGFFYD